MSQLAMKPATRLEIGDTVLLKLPYSEVCMHMQVAGTYLGVRLVGAHEAQILLRDGTPFSFPITPGEAGIYRDSNGFFAHEAAPLVGV